jgi:iron complex outermembrane receptor protein
MRFRGSPVSRFFFIGFLAGVATTAVAARDEPAGAQDPTPSSKQLEAPSPASSPSPTPTPLARRMESVVVRAIRADDVAPVTKKDLSGEEVRSLLWGQEMPVLLQDTPSMTQYSETGSGQGYAYLSLRGVQQTRVNMTFDGVPLNEPEDSAVYTVDFGNLASSIESVQIQRGVGTSTVGAASYAGSIAFASVDPKATPGLDVQLGAGSFGTARASVGWQSGSFGDGWKVYLRPTWQATDGFRDHSGVKQGSLYFTATKDFESSSFRLSGFAGEERIQQAFLAVESGVLEKDLKFNPLSPDEKDHFHEYLVTGQWTRALSSNASLSLQGYVVGAGGWYRLFADEERTDLQQYNLSWLFGGGIATYTRNDGPLHLTLGTHAYEYGSTHSQDEPDGTRNYLNHGYKNEVNGFGKLLVDLGRWHPFLDTQVRWAHLTYSGDAGEASKGWTFFNPKLGVRYDLSPRASAYVSVGRTSREPARSDLLLGQDNASTLPDFDAVRPESVVDVELGAEWRAKNVVVKANLYDMEFRNEIALTGELSAIGLPLRQNAPRSYRRGFELDASWQVLPILRLSGALNLSRSRISEWTQFYDLYDADGNLIGSTGRTFRNVAPVATPPAVVSLSAEGAPVAGLTLGVTGRYVAASFLDNTNADGLTAPRFFQLDASIGFDLSHFVATGRPRLKVQVNNVFDNRRVFPRGYSYLYATRDAAGGETLAGTPYYYPLATRSAYVSLDLGF